jgi:hypothetical protein
VGEADGVSVRKLSTLQPEVGFGRRGELDKKQSMGSDVGEVQAPVSEYNNSEWW